MGFLWQLTIDDYMEICKRAKEDGVKPGESMEKYILEYMKEKNKKPLGTSDKDIDLLTGEFRENGIKVLNLNEIQRRKDNET